MALAFHIKKSGFPTSEERAEKTDKLSKKYGKIVGIYSTTKEVIVLTSTS